jgi:hypothetical protein
MEIIKLLSLLVALQFAAFGWRINREISTGDEGRKTWLPVTDILNILSLFVVVFVCIILPLIGFFNEKVSNIVIAEAFVLIVFHLINMAAHYRLFAKDGRFKYIRANKDFPKITDQEIITYIFTFLTMSVVFILMI